MVATNVEGLFGVSRRGSAAAQFMAGTFFLLSSPPSDLLALPGYFPIMLVAFLETSFREAVLAPKNLLTLQLREAL